MSKHYYKLTREKIIALVLSDMLDDKVADQLITSSQNRTPGTFNENMMREYLNKSKTIWIQPIHYYGGEHFGEPYYYLAEICHTTTNSAFSRFANQHAPWLRE